MLLEYRLRVRNAQDTADDFIITSVRGDSAPWIKEPPTGDGVTLDPLNGRVQAGQYTVLVIDAITSGTTRYLTSRFEDAQGQQQLAGRRAYVEYQVDGGGYSNVLTAGVIVSIKDVDDITRAIVVSEPMRLEHEVIAFAPITRNITCTSTAAVSATTIAVAAIPFALPSGTVLYFAGYKLAILSAAAAVSATSLTVTALTIQINTGDAAVATEPLASFFARWPTRGCLFGGPVIGGFLAQPDLGGWEMNVEESDSDVRWLRFKAGYGAPGFGRTTDPKAIIPAVVEDADNLWNEGVGETYSVLERFDQTRNLKFWSGLVVEVIGSGYFQAIALDRFNGRDVGGDGRFRQLLKADIKPGIFIQAPSLSTGATVKRVRCFTAEASPLSPIYWTGHPIDLLTTLWTDQGFAYSASAASTTKNAIGAHRRISLRITEPRNLGEFLEEVIYAPFGVGTRVNASGELEAFTTRIMITSVPGTTLADADVVQGTVRAYALDADQAIRKVTLEQQRLVRTQDVPSLRLQGGWHFIVGSLLNPSLAQRALQQYQQQRLILTHALDGFLVQEERIERVHSNPLAVGKAEITYRIPGMVHTAESTSGTEAAPFLAAIATEIFDRYAQGALSAELQTLRGGTGDGLKLGDEVLVAVKQVANHNKRRLDDSATAVPRAMQIVELMDTPSGKPLRLIDSGPNANAVATLPTHTIAASSDKPRTIAELTITNASTLNAIPAGIRVRMAVTTGAAPASTDYVDVVAYAAGQVPTAAIRLPAVTAGRKVYAQARSESPGARPSAYQTAVSVTLSAVDPVNTLAAASVANNGHLEDLSWIIGTNATDCVILVWLRLDGTSANTAILQIVLAAGSTRFRLDGMTPNTAYIAGVQARDPYTGDLSSMVEVTFTTANATHTIPPFGFPIPLSGPLGPNPFFRGRTIPTIGFGGSTSSGVESATIYQYGMAFLSTEPCEFEIQEAIETSVGGGSYGSFATIARGLTVQGATTQWWGTAPGDGKRRKLKARGVKEGATASSYTAEVIITPGVPQPMLLPGKRYIYSAVGLLDASSVTDTAARGSGGGFSPTTNVATVGIMEIRLPDGFTITGFETVTFRTAAGDVCTVRLRKWNRSTHTPTNIASHTNNTTGADQTQQTTGLTEVVDSLTYAYALIAECDAVTLGADVVVYDMTVVGDQAADIQS